MKFTQKKKMIFPIMLVFLALYLLSAPEKIVDRIAVFRNSSPRVFDNVAERKFEPSKNVEKNYVEGEAIVKFSDSVASKIGNTPEAQKTGVVEIDRLNSRFGITSMSSLSPKKGDLSRTYRLVSDKANSEEMISAYKQLDIVDYAEANFQAQMSVTNPNDPKYLDGTQWNLNQAADHDINAPEGWDFETGDASGITIAIIDSGVDLDHPDLVNQIWHNGGEIGPGLESNGIDDDGNGYIDDYQGWDWVTSYNNGPADNDPNPEPDGINNDGWYGTDDGVEHGTHVAGIAAAETNNATGIAGVCWDCQIMALRALDDEGWGDYVDIAEAIEYATDNGADVINMSLGGAYSNLLNDAIKEAYTEGVVVVAASGNEALNLQTYRRSPVCNDGNENRVIGVGATNSSGTYYAGSNYGYEFVDAAAPGQSIYSTVFHDAAFGFNNWYEGGWTGTSMASPHVAGLAGLVKAANPTWTAAQIRNRVINLTKNIDSLLGSRARKLGSGLANLDRALDSSNDIYTDGTVVRISGTSAYFVFKSGQRRPINSYFLNLYRLAGPSFTNVNAVVSEQMALNYPRGPEVRWPDGTLFRYYYNPSYVYLIEDGLRRRFTSSSAFYDAGYDANDLITAKQELSYYYYGDNLSVAGSTHPSGVVIKSGGDANYYKIYNDVKMPYAHVGYMKYYRDDTSRAVSVSDAEKNSYSTSDTLRYPGGFIVGDTDTNNIYMVEYNKRRLFSGGEANVTALGFSTLSIIWSDWKADDYTDGDNMPATIAAQ